MIEDIQEDIEFYRRSVKNNDMAIAWDGFDVCDREIILEAINHRKVCSFINSTSRSDEEIASRAIQPYLENYFFTDYDCYTVRNGMDKKK